MHMVGMHMVGISVREDSRLLFAVGDFLPSGVDGMR